MNGMIVGLKKNCSALLASAEEAFAAADACIDMVCETDKRNITRETAVVNAFSGNLPKVWQKSITGFIRVKRSGIRYNSSKTTKKQKKRTEQAAKALKKSATIAPETSIADTTEPTATTITPTIVAVATPPDAVLLPILDKNGLDTGKKRTKNAVYFEETVYYAVTKQQIKAQVAADVCQGHWGLEIFHRYKDVHFNEDNNGIKNTNIASALSQIFNYVLNICVLTAQKSVKIATETLANNINSLFQLVATTKNYQPV
jgi:hypothetical protein